MPALDEGFVVKFFHGICKGRMTLYSWIISTRVESHGEARALSVRDRGYWGQRTLSAYPCIAKDFSVLSPTSTHLDYIEAENFNAQFILTPIHTHLHSTCKSKAPTPQYSILFLALPFTRIVRSLRRGWISPVPTRWFRGWADDSPVARVRGLCHRPFGSFSRSPESRGPGCQASEVFAPPTRIYGKKKNRQKELYDRDKNIKEGIYFICHSRYCTSYVYSMSWY